MQRVTLELLSKSELPSSQRNENKEKAEGDAEQYVTSDSTTDKQEHELHFNGKTDDDDEQEEEQRQEMVLRNEAAEIPEQDEPEEIRDPEMERNQSPEKESEESKENVKENMSTGSGQDVSEGLPDVTLEERAPSDITTSHRTENEIVTEEEGSADPIGRITAEDGGKENDQSVTDLLDESNREEITSMGPPKNPPPPPPSNPLQEESTETSAQGSR